MTGRPLIGSTLVFLGAALLAGCGSTGDVGDTPAASAATVADRSDSAGGGTVGRGTIDAPVEEQLARFAVDGIELTERSPTATPESAVLADGRSLTPCRVFDLRGLSFASDEAELTPAGHALLIDAIGELGSAPCLTPGGGADGCRADQVQLSFDGHTDRVPTARPGGNEHLSLDRAAAAAAVFVDHGFEVRSVVGHADRRPSAAPAPDERTEEEVRRDDRRVEIGFWCSAGR